MPCCGGGLHTARLPWQREVNTGCTVTCIQTVIMRLRSSSFFQREGTVCSHQKKVFRQRSIQPMLSTRAFAHYDLCNFILGLSEEGGTKVLFVSNHPPPIVDTQSWLFNKGICYFTADQKHPSTMNRNREEYVVPEAGMFASEAAPVPFLSLLTLFQMCNPSLTHSYSFPHCLPTSS